MIYILDQDPKKIAEFIDDKSLDKMIRGIAQVLCNVHVWINYHNPNAKALVDTDIPLTKGGIPKWSQWTRECRANYLFMVELGFSCYTECVHRHGITKYNAKYRDIIRWCFDNEPDLPTCKNTGKRCTPDCGLTYCIWDSETTALPLVMPKKYLIYEDEITDEGYGYSPDPNIIRSYRNYYQAKLKTRIETYNEWLDDVSCIGLEGCGSVSIETFESANWTNRKKPVWLKIC